MLLVYYFRDLFNKYDRNYDGFLNRQELEQLVRDLMPEATKAQIRYFMVGDMPGCACEGWGGGRGGGCNLLCEYEGGGGGAQVAVCWRTAPLEQPGVAAA